MFLERRHLCFGPPLSSSSLLQTSSPSLELETAPSSGLISRPRVSEGVPVVDFGRVIHTSRPVNKDMLFP